MEDGGPDEAQRNRVKKVGVFGIHKKGWDGKVSNKGPLPTKASAPIDSFRDWKLYNIAGAGEEQASSGEISTKAEGDLRHLSNMVSLFLHARSWEASKFNSAWS